MPKRATKPRRKVAYRIPLVNHQTGQRIKVAFFQPELDKDDKADPRPRVLQAAEHCWQLILGSKKAKNAIQLLLNEGCDWVQVLFCVEGFCAQYEPAAEQFHRQLSQYLSRVSKKISKFEVRVSGWESAIKQFNQDIMELLNVDLASHAPNFDAYEAALRVARYSALSSGKIPHAPMENMVYVYHLLVESTGRPHYREIADLIEARLRHGQVGGPVLDATDLRDKVKHFQQANEQRYRELKDGAKFGIKVAPPAWFKMPLSRV